VTYCIHL